MTDLRDAARQALKSLRGYRREMGCEQPCDAERALEAALEQPEQVDVLAEYTGDGTHRQWVSTGAWLMPGERLLHAGAGYPPRREWRGLTEEDINAEMPYCHNEFDLAEFKDFARAIEAALKERNA
jgi:hypothetical protein